jgi:hypothetical protein
MRDEAGKVLQTVAAALSQCTTTAVESQHMHPVACLTTVDKAGRAGLHCLRLHRACATPCNRVAQAWLSAASSCSQNQQLRPSLPQP